MRIWSVHPRYLDRQALVACWRETLLAQAVLAGRTKGYTQHPQLQRFRATPEPLVTVGSYLAAIADEADARGYNFDRSRIDEPAATVSPIDVTIGQLDLEWAHLMAKLDVRNPDIAARWRGVERPDPHPSFRAVPGEVESWERARPAGT
ncbi:pyrimidine dimer DNA glycosylase/endonuclease V [Tsukamurella pseudospumae]|uniref:Pyrimidine dimer DNA glycosylase n=1 Tax=Tsukamurella pseudospumae TaxID=239498 RepID=A0A137YT24_9ACTN|nr:pyrimidine dimer DNA glycosylase/endonuclease V [Tsukamurella pseudospumae]KXO89068.1 hypothetical protein AXK61_10615 [Tsukamurella pseudospumae]